MKASDLLANLSGPWRLYVEVGVFVLLVGLIGVQTAGKAQAERQTAKVKQEFSEHVAADERATRKAEQEARTEETRRTAAHREISDEAQRLAARARADAGPADAAAGRVRDRAAQLAAACEARSDPAPAAGGAPTIGPGVMLADMLRRADARAGELARYADEARIAGVACERAYDALTVSR